MSGFLTHLASVALGRTVAGSARPSLPPRYAAPEAEGPIPAGEEVSVEPGPAPSPAAAAAKTPMGSPGDPDRGSPPAAVAPPGEPDLLPASEVSVGPTGVATVYREPRPRPVGHAAAPRRPALAAAPSAIAPAVSRDSPAAPHAPASPQPPPALLQRSEASPVRPASVQVPQRAEPPSATGPTPLAPLSEGAVAGVTEPPRPPAPVIHVTIDRIDVRAPPPSRPMHVARRTPAEPSLSLSDFLAAGSPRPRQ